MNVKSLAIAVFIILLATSTAYAFSDRIYAETQLEIKVEDQSLFLVARQVLEYALKPHQFLWIITEGERNASDPLSLKGTRFGTHIGFEHRINSGSIIVGRHRSTDGELTHYLQWAMPW